MEIVAEHGYTVLFLWVFAEQAGLPIPAIPILLVMGAMASMGRVNFAATLLLAVIACLLADLLWYYLGRRGGMRVLRLLCKVSLEPDSCVRQTEAAFSTQGLRLLLYAKFVPGLSTAATPLAGAFHLSTWRFILYDAAGSLAWVAVYVSLGAVFSNQLQAVEQRISQLAGSLLAAAVVALGLYLFWKILKRELIIRELRTARLSARELKAMMDAGDPVVIVDLRHPVEYEAAPDAIVGALRISPEELAEKHEQIPRDQDVILYCT